MMGITLGELRNRLIGELDVIPAASTKDRINDALKEIYSDNEWGFLFADGFIRIPAIIEGTAEVTKFSAEVILSQAVTDLINGINELDVDILQRQFRSLSRLEVDRGFTYNIIDWDSNNNKLTIDPPYQDVSNVSAKIQILKLYYLPPYYNPPYEKEVDPVPDPIIDFKRFEYVISPQFNRRLILDATQAEINRFDPYREYAAEPRYLLPNLQNSFGEPTFELYPAPRFARLLRVIYLRKGLPLNKDSDQAPDIFSKELIISKAKVESYIWAKGNADKLKLKTVGKFDNLIALAENKYQKLLQSTIKEDEDRYPKAYLGNVVDSYPEYERDFECHGETLLLNF